MAEVPYLPHFISERAKIFEDAGIECARVEMEWILCHVLDIDRLGLHMRGSELLNKKAIERVNEIIARRVQRYPLQFILEESWFYGRKFYVNSSVMAPTPETESLCEAAIKFTQAQGISHPRILDVGTGSGVIAVTIAAELKDCSVVALDISGEALDVARKNAHDIDVADRIEFHQSDFFSALATDDRFDLILSNPPYICDDDYPTLQKEVLEDPKIAMLGGKDGLDAIRVVVREAPDYLALGGRIMFEIGFGQVEGVAKLTETDDRYTSFSYIKDLAGVDRIIILGCAE
ncbi:MAG: peptide chain release factor N(5)-glutamine methyltransferase [candidate division Zixibacteria bacterium]|nr:peptide chain release factor N(5)-glutamine methyltransferase [candidate division Zixibacteria bacterium]